MYFITEKSPLRRLSESFFSHYGDPGYTYFGTLGLENFLNDLLKGKNRYKHCDIKHLFWPIDGESSIRTDFRKDKNEELFINIYYMQWKGNYRLIRHLTPYRPAKQLSRFELDRCYLVSQEQFQKELFEVNALKAQALFDELFSKTQ
ncbi:hypothetical protein [Legionella sp. 16cNR16C]|uniref:hypothetical protein n=1 Tax=Legionella sp. 16cNR16C TaxID=2905656 RepID=UPI001E516FF5|nr:hypothetical protein [Legionella sp. 16cNR16C]MCE3044159.1 hypothetical protein [Legionella sp. 16cNR16C]